eukprot:TRINITY_DN2167_c0_g1_i1.p1 TRINITY_DN2167_c0_g1~~TRINITY_DN2167_c0_g1_i1.p1  ORF type:complete len:355 (+),score=67.77 TRINITY_DN2167_c0_g1_i1:34-1098(+)
MIISISSDGVKEGTSKEYDLKKDVPLEEQVRIICSELGIPASEASKYSLFTPATRMYITQEALQNSYFNLPTGSVVKLKLKPEVNAENVLSKLKGLDSSEVKQQSLIYLKQQLQQDKAFAHKFIEKDGMKVILTLISEEGSKDISFSLQVLEIAVSNQVGWNKIDEDFVLKLLVHVTPGGNPTSSRKALDILNVLAQSPLHGWEFINEAMNKYSKQEKKKPYENVAALLPANISNCLAALRFITSLINAIKNDVEKKDFCAKLDDLLVYRLLHKCYLLHGVLPDFKHELYSYQKAKFSELREGARIQYDKNSESHEKSLIQLWDLIYPETKLESRVSNQWKRMGFQGKDPAAHL